MLARLRRLDLALYALLAEACATVIYPVVFRGYCTDGPGPSTLAVDASNWLLDHGLAVALAVCGVALVESRWELRQWVKRASRLGAGLGLLFLLTAPWWFLRLYR